MTTFFDLFARGVTFVASLFSGMMAAVIAPVAILLVLVLLVSYVARGPKELR